jgi:hypothetical protein
MPPCRLICCDAFFFTGHEGLTAFLSGLGPSEEDILHNVAIVLDVAHLLALITSGSLHSLTLGPIGLVTFFRWGP